MRYPQHCPLCCSFQCQSKNRQNNWPCTVMYSILTDCLLNKSRYIIFYIKAIWQNSATLNNFTETEMCCWSPAVIYFCSCGIVYITGYIAEKENLDKLLKLNQSCTVFNIWSGSKKFIKVVLRKEHSLVLGFRTTSMKGFVPLQMLKGLTVNYCGNVNTLKQRWWYIMIKTLTIYNEVQ